MHAFEHGVLTMQICMDDNKSLQHVNIKNQLLWDYIYWTNAVLTINHTAASLPPGAIPGKVPCMPDNSYCIGHL